MAHPTVSRLSACIVTPSTPTTQHHHMFLVSVDILFQWHPYNQYVLFFKRTADKDLATCTDDLKSSLALALVEFFPWAGRLFEEADGRLALDCNDAGVPFTEASIDIPFSSLEASGFQRQPLFAHLAPHGDTVEWAPGLPLLSVQVTRFADNAGISIGIGFSHVVADGRSFWHFMKSWGECARGLPISLHPIHMRDALRPEKLILPPAPPAPLGGQYSAVKSIAQGQRRSFGLSDPELVHRDFHFSGGMIKKLKNLAAASSCVEAEPAGAAAATSVSSFQALSGHIWKHVTAARCVDKSRESGVRIAMDTRARCIPPLPNAYFGNAVHAKAVIATAQELEEESLGRTAMRIMQVVRSLENNEVKTAYGELEVPQERVSTLRAYNGVAMIYVIGSPQFPLYEVDFGWGSPAHVQWLNTHRDGVVALGAGPEGGGSVVVSMVLSRAAMEKLEQDQGFMAF